MRPRTQKRRPGFSRVTRKASGTTMRFVVSYCSGMPSKHFRRSSAHLPRCDLCGSMPRMTR
eukprot:scaffold6334_cov137-Isochrysis_galbana.AAC.3